ncbi:TetR family transcriptional regulator [Roseovarius sp. A46]|uniref:TetR/AcrR family transcriptional regulator n=1 Tax=Roseovarius sp. A46 TaxID=2109331 RepID=UPI001012BBC6|nr:TetR/AcrR family transcriptional regulator [Roseovarius sp. A46]RXV66619.1 TetR family transcriptional regulator [Roseovarius sp. A46]
MAKQGYHHGNLREALVEATLALIVAKGPQGFTLSEAARHAGVTPAAIYRHFAGRDDLVAETARQGYELFSGMLSDVSAERGAPRVRAMARAYLAFAERYPGHYIAMFESGIDLARRPALAEAAGRARDLLHGACDGLCADVEEVAAHIWSLSHGVVELYLRNSAGLTDPPEARATLSRALDTYLSGLGPPASQTSR